MTYYDSDLHARMMKRGVSSFGEACEKRDLRFSTGGDLHVRGIG